MKLLLICLLMCSAGFADGVGKIAGRVVDENGDGVIGANVEILGTKQSVTVSTGSGRFTLINVASGSHNVRITAIGYKPVRLSGVVVSKDKTTQLKKVVLEEYVTCGPGLVKIVDSRPRYVFLDEANRVRRLTRAELGRRLSW